MYIVNNYIYIAHLKSFGFKIDYYNVIKQNIYLEIFNYYFLIYVVIRVAQKKKKFCDTKKYINNKNRTFIPRLAQRNLVISHVFLSIPIVFTP